MADLTPIQRAHILLEDDAFCLWPAYTGVSSDDSVVTVGDGGEYRLAAIAHSEGTATITITRAADGATADLEVTVGNDDPAGPFTIHLGTPYQ